MSSEFCGLVARRSHLQALPVRLLPGLVVGSECALDGLRDIIVVDEGAILMDTLYLMGNSALTSCEQLLSLMLIAFCLQCRCFSYFKI